MTNLNSIQLDVVENSYGPMMVLAGAGSGKTKTLVEKISHLILKLHIDPLKILTLTFSNKAAKEMKTRVNEQLNLSWHELQTTTFHGFCASIVRHHAEDLGLTSNFTIFDAGESKSLIKAVLVRRGISLKECSPFEVLSFIEDLKNNGYYRGRDNIGSVEKKIGHEFYEYYLEYETELHRSNALDFGGLIIGVLRLFEQFPEILKRYQEAFEFILVDEYQDTNKAQFELICHMSRLKKNICVVGDEDQSIYSWRGANIWNILDFEKFFPNVKMFKLEENYRSSKMIIEAAAHVIDHNEIRKDKKMFTQNPEGELIEVIQCKGEKEEAYYVAQRALKFQKLSINFNELAIFYRTNAQSRAVEDALRRLNIPYRIVGGLKFYERLEIKDLLSYFRLLSNEKDSMALARIINKPSRGIGATTLRKLESIGNHLQISLWEVLKNIVEHPEEYPDYKFSKKISTSIEQFVHFIEEMLTLQNEGVPPSFLYEKILEKSKYLEDLKSSKDYESLARIENLKELVTAIKQFEETKKDPSLIDFLESITLNAQSSREDQNQGQISLMTIHGSKGLEFSHVFIVGVEENIFPSFKSLDQGKIGIEEERRLFYVAMTRAKKKLIITFAEGRLLFGQFKLNEPSRFLSEMPDRYKNIKNMMS